MIRLVGSVGRSWRLVVWSESEGVTLRRAKVFIITASPSTCMVLALFIRATALTRVIALRVLLSIIWNHIHI
jgi:hypothetical protein